MDDFFKFPSTPYFAVLGKSVVRDDKIMSESERVKFLLHEIVVEEKVDGANLGISFDPSGQIMAQNRGAFIQPPYSGQWKKLNEWLIQKSDKFFDILEDHYILFGEWCYAQHSIRYDRLPDWFLGFDLLDKGSGKFLSCQRRDEMFQLLGIFGVPILKQGFFSIDDLILILSNSCLSNHPAEGLYLRYDIGDWLGERAKIVRPEFIQTNAEHWTHKPIVPNRTCREAWG